MELYLCRAMEVCRLPDNDLKALQEFEKAEKVMKGFDRKTNEYKEIVNKTARCLYPFEIQAIFGLGSLKERWGIPEDEAAQSAHNQRLRGEFRSKGLMPVKGDFNVNDVEDIHSFDERVKTAYKEMKITLEYMGGSARKRRASDEL